MRVASKVGNRPSEFGHIQSPLGSRIIRYVHDGRTDIQTDGRTKATLIAPSLRGRDIITVITRSSAVADKLLDASCY